MSANSRTPRHLALILGALSMLGPFSIDTMFPAFRAMAAQFSADKLAMQQTISVYLLAYAVMSVVHGPLSDALGRRRVIVAGLLLFALASVGCALSTSLPMLLAFRALQGLSAGVGMIVGRAVIRDLFAGDDAQRLMSQVSVIFGVAPALAPIVGGWLLGWQWPSIFWFLALFSLLLLLAVLLRLPETLPHAARQPLQPLAMLQGYWTMLKNPRFMRLALAASCNFSAAFLYIASAPAVVGEHLRLAEDQFGWLFVPMISGMMLGAWLSGRAAGRLANVQQLRIGFACCLLAACLNLAYHGSVPQPSLWPTVLPIVLNAFGIALVFPILTLLILDMFPANRGAASSLQSFTSLLLNAGMAGVISPWLSHDLARLASAAGLLSLLAWGLWRWEHYRQISIVAARSA